MRASALKYALVTGSAGIIMLILLLVPFHAFLTIWAADIFGHYTAFRLWKEALLLFCVLVALYLVIFDHKIRSHTLTRRLAWVILLYVTVVIAWGLAAYYQQAVSIKAMLYGVLVDTRFLIFFLVVWAIALRTDRLRHRWQPIVLYPAAIVVVVGLLQALVLPHDFLAHFGYNASTIYPYETINHNQNYIRIMATLRGANPLGAYLLIPISVLTVLLVQGQRNWRNYLLLAGSVAALFFSYSRSAWIGAVLAVGVILVLSLKTKVAKQRAIMGAVAACFLLVALTAVAHQNVHFQNIFLHTQDNSAAKVSSNDDHAKALQEGVEDVVDEPLGDGVGSAGPASVYNKKPARIAENYYVQIGQEMGLIGLGLFLLINAGVAYLLWLRRSDPLALCLLASLIGISFINLLSHAWTDDTLAYLWWGLAGIAMVMAKPQHTKKTNTDA